MSDDQYEGGVDTSVSPADLIGESVSTPTTPVEEGASSVTETPVVSEDGSGAATETPQVSEIDTLRQELEATKREAEAKEKLARLHQSRADKLQAEWGPKIQEAERLQREQEAARFASDDAFQQRINEVGYVQAHAELSAYQARQVAQATEQRAYEARMAEKWQSANVEFYKYANGLGMTNAQAEALVAPFNGFAALGDPDKALDACKNIIKANAPAKSAESVARAAEQRVRQLAAQQNPKGTTGTSIGGETSGVGDEFFASLDKAKERNGLRDIL